MINDIFIVIAEKHRKTNIEIVYNILNSIEKITGVNGFPLIVFGETASPVLDGFSNNLYASRIYGEVPLLGGKGIVDYGIHEAYEWAQDTGSINEVHVIIIWSADYKSRSLDYYLQLLHNFSGKVTMIILRPSIPTWLATMNIIDYFDVRKIRKNTNIFRLMSDVLSQSSSD